MIGLFSFCLLGLLKSPLRWNNYSEKFHLLLELEEQQMNRALIKYNIPNRNMKYAVMFRDRVNSDLLVLEVNMCDAHSHSLPHIHRLFLTCSHSTFSSSLLLF